MFRFGLHEPQGETAYSILNVTRDCTDDEVKRAYRKLALRLHPDKTPSVTSSVDFNKVKEAYESIKTAEARQAYSLAQLYGVNTSGVDPTHAWLNAMFARTAPPPPPNRTATAPPSGAHTISLLEAYTGCKRRVTRSIPCAFCNGGGLNDTVIMPCTRCKGKGHIRRVATLNIPRGCRNNALISTLGTDVIIHVAEDVRGFRRVGDDLIAPTQTVCLEQLLTSPCMSVPFLDGKPLSVVVDETSIVDVIQMKQFRLHGKGFSVRGSYKVPLRVQPPSNSFLSKLRTPLRRDGHRRWVCAVDDATDFDDNDEDVPSCVQQ